MVMPAVEHAQCPEVDDGEVLNTEHHVIERLEAPLQPLHLGIRGDHVGVTTRPYRVAGVFAIEDLDALDGPRRLYETRVLSRAGVHEIKRALAEHPIERYAQHRVDEHGAHHHQAQAHAVDEHHAGCQHCHCAVHHGGDQSFGKQVADRLDRTEARNQVANVPALEECQRQLQQMAEQTGAKFIGEPALQIDQDARSQQTGAGVEQHGKAKAHGEHAEQRSGRP